MFIVKKRILPSNSSACSVFCISTSFTNYQMDNNLNNLVNGHGQQGDGHGAHDHDHDGQEVIKTTRKYTSVERRNGQKSTFIIREVYDDASSNFQMQLENSINIGYDVIVIEPMKLGDETAKYIALGNLIHKSAVTSGLTSIVGSYLFPDKPLFSATTAIFSLFCTGLYTFSWQKDNCSKYQVETDLSQIGIPLQALASSSPVVIVKKDDSRRRILHWIATSLAGFYFGWRFLYPIPLPLQGTLLYSSNNNHSSNPTIMSLPESRK